MLAALRLLAEQSLTGTRAEAETSRAVLRAADTGIAERIIALRGAYDMAMEQMRTVLSREQGELRLALAEAQRKSTEQIGAQFETTRGMIEAKLREMREGNEGKLAEIQKSVNEQLHAAVEKQMNESFNRVIDQFAAVQKAMGDVQAVTAQIGDIKRLFSNVKTRGGWGETQVRAMLDDILPPGAYETNRKVRPDSDEAVEFVVIMPMRGDSRREVRSRSSGPAWSRPFFLQLAAVVGDQHRVALAGSETVERQHRLAVGSACWRFELHHQHALLRECRMLDRRRDCAYHPPELHFPSPRSNESHAAHDAASDAGDRRLMAWSTPSPVGPAIENDKTPSPPRPRPAVHGPLTTKIVQSMILPIFDITDVSREWSTAVWPKPCSLSFARPIARSTLETRTNGRNGIICS